MFCLFGCLSVAVCTGSFVAVYSVYGTEFYDCFFVFLCIYGSVQHLELVLFSQGYVRVSILSLFTGYRAM